MTAENKAQDNKPDYKSTIRLPQTDFPMKGNLNVKEPEIIKRWQDQKIYQKLMAKNKGKAKFVLPDGPPYANGSIHIGHALNKTLKDIVIKYKNMRGFHSPFIPGWDCHGLPIEHAVLKNLGPKAKEKTDAEIRALCREEASKWINHQRPQFIRLGVLADWEHPYLTMDAGYEAEGVREFARAYEKGLVYLGTKPVYWNWTLMTALADAEVEYHPHKSPAIYVKFAVKDAATLKKLGNPKKPLNFVIWTTTPWTLPANLGIALHPDFDYGIFDTGSDLIVIAKSLKEFVEKDTGVALKDTGFSIKGKELELLKARHPFYDRDSLIVLGDHVTSDAGTGAVHTAPGHGADDYKVGLKYGMEILSPVDERGQYTDEVPEYKGVNIFKANPLIIERLKESGRLMGVKELEHSYPHCWRTKTPLIFRATPQWFIGLDIEGKELRKVAMAEVAHIQFFPQWGEARFRGMVEGRPDWCLSRQRIWGVPIPIFYCLKTGQPLVDYDVMMKVADTMENDGGIEAFFKYSPDFFIGDTIQRKGLNEINADFGSQGFKAGKDIFDVWFDSGICHAAVQKKREGMAFPADIYLEGSDQHRGWFNTSLISSVATNGKAPFKALITHGFVMDSQGMKQSKSKGNVVDPNDVAGKSGAEIIRLWTAYEDYSNDVKCGAQEFERVTETYRRIRNTMRFLLGATSDFDPKKDAVAYDKMTEIDRWALAQLFDLNQKMIAAYDEYSFVKVYHLLNHFFTVELSATYLDILKDRLYTWKYNGLPRRSAQTVIHTLTDYLVRMMAPVLSFLSEEAYSYMPGEKQDSVFLLDFPVAPKEWSQPDLLHKFEGLLQVRTDVQKVLEGMRAQKIIGASLEAKVSLRAEGELLNTLRQFHGNGGLKSDLREFLIVSDVELLTGSYEVKAEKSSGEKCARCWIYSSDTGKNPAHAAVCSKCCEALST
jgi:isoleucyl-tRNA synthetase